MIEHARYMTAGKDLAKQALALTRDSLHKVKNSPYEESLERNEQIKNLEYRMKMIQDVLENGQ